jgi:hypothetical protein
MATGDSLLDTHMSPAGGMRVSGFAKIDGVVLCGLGGSIVRGEEDDEAGDVFGLDPAFQALGLEPHLVGRKERRAVKLGDGSGHKVSDASV